MRLAKEESFALHFLHTMYRKRGLFPGNSVVFNGLHHNLTSLQSLWLTVKSCKYKVVD